eukprot:m.170705 g.170705  ORF g.170705 m.170705 type:complete len:79 (-) comp53260_c0_seq4:193-429(-)
MPGASWDQARFANTQQYRVPSAAHSVNLMYALQVESLVKKKLGVFATGALSCEAGDLQKSEKDGTNLRLQEGCDGCRA